MFPRVTLTEKQQHLADTLALLNVREPAGETLGLDPAAANRFLRSDDEVDSVHADNLRAHRLGINGVPCFVISGRHAIAGAQEPEVIERLLDVAAVEASEL